MHINLMLYDLLWILVFIMSKQEFWWVEFYYNLPKEKSKSILPSFSTFRKKNKGTWRSFYFHGYPWTKIKILLVVIKLAHHNYLNKVLLNFNILPSIVVCMVLSYPDLETFFIHRHVYETERNFDQWYIHVHP